MGVGHISCWKRIAWWESSIDRYPRRFMRRITARRFFIPALNKACPIDLEAQDRHVVVANLIDQA